VSHTEPRSERHCDFLITLSIDDQLQQAAWRWVNIVHEPLASSGFFHDDLAMVHGRDRL
jgi:hypothetical protein